MSDRMSDSYTIHRHADGYAVVFNAAADCELSAQQAADELNRLTGELESLKIAIREADPVMQKVIAAIPVLQAECARLRRLLDAHETEE